MQFWLCPLLAFLIGSIPFGLLIARAKGIDIRAHGSGNIGATNVLRVVGRNHGILCLLLDLLKGFIPVVIALNLIHIDGKAITVPLPFLQQWMATIPRDHALPAQLAHVGTALAAILGHNFSPWLGFKGGKGIATSGGVLLALMPAAVLILILVWTAVFLTSRYVSVASIAAAAALPVLTHLGARFHRLDEADPASPTLWQAGAWNKPLFFFTLTVAVLAIWRHRDNLRRLAQGTESRFQRKPKSS
jgi:glycerol-3-phosphate acyltransferase PlsY